MADRIMTTHVGSLIRPPHFVEILTKLEKKEPVEPGTLRKDADAIRRRGCAPTGRGERRHRQ